jgi:hypothetical protein
MYWRDGHDVLAGESGNGDAGVRMRILVPIATTLVPGCRHEHAHPTRGTTPREGSR